MNFLRFLLLLSLVTWIGSIIYFAAVLAPTVFSVLPTRHLAGAVVTRGLTSLHWIGIISGVVFLASSVTLSYFESGTPHALTPRNLLVVVMLLLTLFSQFVIMPKMAALRADMGEIDTVATDDPRRIEFNQWHVWSTRMEGGVLLVGLALLYLVARRLTL